METFPTNLNKKINRGYYSEIVYKKQLKTEFESGVVQTRPVHTRAKSKWTIGWNNLFNSEYQILKAFFKRNIGKKFLWTDPSGDTYTVSFSNSTLQSGKVIGVVGGENIWDTGQVELEERV